MTLNNHQAQLQVRYQVPVTTQSAVSVSTIGAPIVNTVQMRDTGVILQVTPRVNKNGLVQLDISQEVSNSIPTTTFGIDSPTIQERKLSSTAEILGLFGLVCHLNLPESAYPTHKTGTRDVAPIALLAWAALLNSARILSVKRRPAKGS